MSLLQTMAVPKPFLHLRSINDEPYFASFPEISHQNPSHYGHNSRRFPCFSVSKKSDPESSSNPKMNCRGRTRRPKIDGGKEGVEISPITIPRKPKRGRRTEAVAVEDFVRDSLERTFASIRQQNPDLIEEIMKDKANENIDSETSDDDDDDDDEESGDEDGKGKEIKKKMVVEEESRDWPLDADLGWGVRASEYFEKHPIKNVVGEDGFEIDWEGEMEDNWVNEINCLDWERFAFHPSPLIVLVFERYHRATDNWKTLKELEKAARVYRGAKDRLPPRTVKIDINIERDLAYALKVKECPQILFLRGNKILYREKEFRTADELVQMIAHFYYNAKKPSCVNNANLCP
ncbi:THIOREDOXIN-LIKE FOLD DOMAIN-CONTAINING PROTEIN MRL7L CHLOROPLASTIC [Salix viminalis]|uniref:THIOREDOXIN-LIKE FOLD DOMAIN-CONTAINING PROTEIN MRL7L CHLOROPLASTIC n=1 Tax=Salix viminalis TaxID=40686 RepID=A0A9Q0SER6_SALVM|nr:THIOREDOXIN-LIKE FOLD DOMAIN-CONTAINING PROTEIN MRL7L CHLOROPLASTIC [Salix viminalis]